MAEKLDAGRAPDGYMPVHLCATAPPEGNGATFHRTKNASTFTQIAVKAGPATLYGLWINNGQAAIVHVQIFNKLTANVTPGTTVPDLEFAVPVSVLTTIPIPACGINFDTGLTIFCSTASEGATGSAAAVGLEVAYQ